MPDRGGIDILRHVRAGHAGTRILVLSGYPERQYAMNVLRAGANGYIAKDSSPEELMKAIRIVLQGRRYVSESLAELLRAGLRPGRQAAAQQALGAGVPDLRQARERAWPSPRSRASSA